MSLCEAGYFSGREWVDSPYCGAVERHRSEDRCFVGWPKFRRDRAGSCEDFTDAWKSSALCGGVPDPMSEVEVNRRVLARIRRMTPAEAFALSVSAGIHKPDGGLTPEYGGEDEP